MKALGPIYSQTAKVAKRDSLGGNKRGREITSVWGDYARKGREASLRTNKRRGPEKGEPQSSETLSMF